ncbi:hypothetical protein [Insulibacter thermoxylanivorax]|uniref:hypothetical protein n=1 Tax=Insulibacter thermoxylanivorax TaxID=2749268 RepID=UPI00190FDD17|nr:hypothetical protein [Insulibacter thermoxylanivorax]
MKNPIVETAKKFPGVEEASVEFAQGAVNLRLVVNKEADLHGVIDALHREAANAIGGRNLKIDIIDHASERLDEWWSQVLFEVAEVMEKRSYSDLPKILEANKLAGMSIDTAIDDTYVYIRLVDGDHVKFVLLERMPALMGVWTSE